jgi:hypothetical protein
MIDGLLRFASGKALSMPSLTVSLDGSVVATACCDGFDVVTVRVSGTRVEEDFSNLEFTGGRYPDSGESTYLTWINQLPLQPGQQVYVSLLQEGKTSHPGETIDELFPDDDSTAMQEEFEPSREIFEELRRRPNRRDGYAFQYQSTSGTLYAGQTSADDHGFGFTVLWNSQRPQQVSVSLDSYTIDNVEQRAPGHDHVREYLQVGQSVTVEIGAPDVPVAATASSTPD